MDITVSAGATKELPQGLLEILGLDVLKKAREWTLTQKYGCFYLDVVFTAKSFKSPAKTCAKKREQEHLEKSAQDGPNPPRSPSGVASLKKSADASAGGNKSAEKRSPVQPDFAKPVVVKSTKKKRKSPSTRRRNRLRWERWQAKWKANRKLPNSSRQSDLDSHHENLLTSTKLTREPVSKV